jgi:hypothetical protein
MRYDIFVYKTNISVYKTKNPCSESRGVHSEGAVSHHRLNVYIDYLTTLPVALTA